VSTWNSSPDTPQTIVSPPLRQNPASSSASQNSLHIARLSTGSRPSPPPTLSAPWKGDESTNSPFNRPALPVRLSMSMPMVILDGKAWGLMSRSGRMPVASWRTSEARSA